MSTIQNENYLKMTIYQLHQNSANKIHYPVDLIVLNSSRIVHHHTIILVQVENPRQQTVRSLQHAFILILISFIF